MAIDLNGLIVKNLVFIGAGPAKYGRGYEIYENPISYFLFRLRIVNPRIFAGVVTRTITIETRKGNYKWYMPWKVLRRIENGWTNRFGWNNYGIKKFVGRVYPVINLDNLVVSLGALRTVRELLVMIAMLNRVEILAIELNISCPHVDILFRSDLKKLEECFKKTREESRHPLIVKLGHSRQVVDIAKIAEACGINAVCAINTVPTFIVGFGKCGKSGKIIKPEALKTVERISRNVKIPVIGGGGIESPDDCRDFFRAGAQAVFISSLFFNPVKLLWFIKRIGAI